MVKTITREELRSAIDAGEVTVVETLRTEHFEHGHLPAAIHIHFEAVEDKAPELAPDRNASIVTYCSAGNRIAAIPDALDRTRAASGGGTTLAHGHRLASPLGLAIAPDGDVLTVNAGDGRLDETTPSGKQVSSRTLVAHGAGDLFGLAVAPNARGVYFVDDAGSGPDANSLALLH
jgi:hypothetical protein